MKKLCVLFIVLVVAANAFCQNAFKVIPLGVKGGSDESNLSAYMIAPSNSNAYVCLDAGTLNAGIQKAIWKALFKGPATKVLRQNIKGYLISHGHLDHLSGLVLNSPDDTSKNIYALPSVIDVFREKYFTRSAWANFADDGEQPRLNKYHYATLEAAKEIPLDNTDLFVTAFPLSHGTPYESTAFLVRNADHYLLYLGDTGPDEIEKSDKLNALWKAVAPLIKNNKLKAIFIECSFPNEQADKQLFGHLTPNWLMKEMDALAGICGKEPLKRLAVVITHIKPAGNHEALIKKQLAAANDLGLKLLFPEQGKMMRF